jgi:hypothetical protein
VASVRWTWISHAVNADCRRDGGGVAELRQERLE